MAQTAAFTALFGTGFWKQILQAQFQAGHGLELQAGSWVQAGWNLMPLVIFAAAAIALHRHARDRPTLLTVGAAAMGTLLTTLTIVKPGTGLNVLVPSEPLLATLAMAGVVWALRTPALVRVAAVAALTLLLLAQSASLLLDPGNPRPFHRPASSVPGWKVSHGRARCERSSRRRAAAPRAPPTPARRWWPSSRTAACPPISPTCSSSAAPPCTRARTGGCSRRSLAVPDRPLVGLS